MRHHGKPRTALPWFALRNVLPLSDGRLGTRWVPLTEIYYCLMAMDC